LEERVAVMVVALVLVVGLLEKLEVVT